MRKRTHAHTHTHKHIEHIKVHIIINHWGKLTMHLMFKTSKYKIETLALVRHDGFFSLVGKFVLPHLKIKSLRLISISSSGISNILKWNWITFYSLSLSFSWLNSNAHSPYTFWAIQLNVNGCGQFHLMFFVEFILYSIKWNWTEREITFFCESER